MSLVRLTKARVHLLVAQQDLVDLGSAFSCGDTNSTSTNMWKVETNNHIKLVNSDLLG